jgi:DNA-binding MarR family transcriptional regulator
LLDLDPHRRDHQPHRAELGREIGRQAGQPRQLSDEMGRIASTLARLSSTPDESGGPMLQPTEPHGELPPLAVNTVRSVIRARRLRARYFAEDLFADPAWDMLLDLLQAEIAQHRVPVSSLCIAAAVPATTALRWIKSMTDSGLFVRRADPHDGRRVFVELSRGASEAMRRYFAEIGSNSVAA